MSHTTVTTTEPVFDGELTTFHPNRQALQNMKGHARVFDDDFPEFVTLQNALASVESRVGSLEIDKKAAKTTEKDFSERLTRLENLVKKHSSNLKNFYEHLRVIEDAALEFQTPAVALKLRRCVDDARFSIVDGFMTVFPEKFKAEKVLNKYDASRTTVEWNIFVKLLSSLLQSHGRFRAGEYPTIVQGDSAFKACDGESLLSIHGVNTGPFDPVAQPEGTVPEVSLFKGKPEIGGDFEFDPANPSEPGIIPLDKWLHTHFKVYVPVFVWAFNVLKLSIYQEDVAIRLLARSIVRDREAIRDFRHTIATEAELKEAEEVKDPLPPISSFFEVGTGSSLRKDPKWQQFFKDLEDTKKARKDANKEEKMAGNNGLKTPAVTLASRMRSFGVARNLKEDPNESNIDRLLNSTQTDVENRVKERDLLKRLRSLRVQRFNIVAKCLGILLNNRVLNLAIYGRSLACTLYCRSAHKRNALNQQAHALFFEGLDQVQGMIDGYWDDTVAAHHFNEAEELEELAVLEGLNLHSPSEVRQNAANARLNREAAISSLHKKITDGLKNFNIIGDTQELYELIYKSDDYFDKHDGSLERAVDLHLQNMDKSLASQDWKKTTGDTQLLMAWLEKVQSNLGAANI